jgi:hypothetical protein
MARTQRWSDLSSRQKVSVLGFVALQAVLVAAAQRDMSGRRADQVRGPKVLWRLLGMNTLGTLAYFVIGRRGNATV